MTKPFKLRVIRLRDGWWVIDGGQGVRRGPGSFVWLEGKLVAGPFPQHLDALNRAAREVMAERFVRNVNGARADTVARALAAQRHRPVDHYHYSFRR